MVILPFLPLDFCPITVNGLNAKIAATSSSKLSVFLWDCEVFIASIIFSQLNVLFNVLKTSKFKQFFNDYYHISTIMVIHSKKLIL